MTRVDAIKIYEYLLRVGEEVCYVNKMGKSITREECAKIIFAN